MKGEWSIGALSIYFAAMPNGSPRFIAALASTHCPTDPFPILEPQDQENGKFHEVQERRATDFGAPKLRKGRSGKRNDGRN